LRVGFLRPGARRAVRHSSSRRRLRARHAITAITAIEMATMTC
jgi:hypothetical protein